MYCVRFAGRALHLRSLLCALPVGLRCAALRRRAILLHGLSRSVRLQDSGPSLRSQGARSIVGCWLKRARRRSPGSPEAGSLAPHWSARLFSFLGLAEVPPRVIADVPQILRHNLVARPFWRGLDCREQTSDVAFPRAALYHRGAAAEWCYLNCGAVVVCFGRGASRLSVSDP